MFGTRATGNRPSLGPVGPLASLPRQDHTPMNPNTTRTTAQSQGAIPDPTLPAKLIA
jgi:hypothetical protein